MILPAAFEASMVYRFGKVAKLMIHRLVFFSSIAFSRSETKYETKLAELNLGLIVYQASIHNNVVMEYFAIYIIV